MVSHDQVLHVGEAARRPLQQVMACDWLGQAAIALGVARRSLRDSRAYTAQRYQGGRTHCLQTLGGYGYMEDYPFERRLRDVSTLKSLHGAPDQLRLLLNELAKDE